MTIKLPLLPFRQTWDKVDGIEFDLFTSQQMQAYATQAVEAYKAEFLAKRENYTANEAEGDAFTDGYFTALEESKQQQGEAVAHLWQHGETGRTSVWMSGDAFTAGPSWQHIGALHLRPAPAPQQGESSRVDFEARLDEYLADYEMVGEAPDGRDVCYTPTADERAIIKDVIMGFEWEPAPAQPLSNEQIARLSTRYSLPYSIISFVRAIEHAHSIGGMP
jgi:hypothetical protein